MPDRADCKTVTESDLGPSSLYGQYSDYKSFALDIGYRRYMPLTRSMISPNSRSSVWL